MNLGTILERCRRLRELSVYNHSISPCDVQDTSTFLEALPNCQQLQSLKMVGFGFIDDVDANYSDSDHRSNSDNNSIDIQEGQEDKCGYEEVETMTEDRVMYFFEEPLNIAFELPQGWCKGS